MSFTYLKTKHLDKKNAEGGKRLEKTKSLLPEGRGGPLEPKTVEGKGAYCGDETLPRRGRKRRGTAG